MAWREVTVAEIAAPIPNALSTGPFGSAISSRFFTASGVPVIRGGNLSQEVGIRLNDDGLVFVEPAKAKEFSRSIAREGDLVFTCWGTIDQVGLIDGRSRFREYVISNKQMKLTPDRSVADSLFLYYFFSSEETRGAIRNAGIGSSVPGFNLGQLRGMRIPLPPMEEQHAITSILGALDDKIDLNRRMSETLEETARALFKSWFVDFDPVRAKTEGRKPFGMDPETAALFPDAFEESEVGRVPNGWSVQPLVQVAASIRRGIGPAYVEAGGVLVLNQKCVRDHRVGLDQARRHDRLRRPVDDRLLEVGDVLVNSTGVGTLGRVAQVLRLPECAIVDSHVTVVRANPATYLPVLLGQLLVLREAEIEALGEGSTGQTELSRERLGQLLVVVPPLGVQARIGAVLTSFDARATSLQFETEQLAALRDYLLPKLLSGDVRVRDAKKLAEAVA